MKRTWIVAVVALGLCCGRLDAAELRAWATFEVGRTYMPERQAEYSKVAAEVIATFQSALKPLVDLRGISYQTHANRIDFEVKGQWREVMEARLAAERVKEAAMGVQQAHSANKVALVRLKVECTSHEERRGESAPGRAPPAAPAVPGRPGEGARRAGDGPASDPSRGGQAAALDVPWMPAPRFSLVLTEDGGVKELKVTNTPIVRALDMMTAHPRVAISYVLGPEVLGRPVNVALRTVTLDEALDAIADSAGLRVDRRGKYVRLVDPTREPAAGRSP